MGISVLTTILPAAMVALVLTAFSNRILRRLLATDWETLKLKRLLALSYVIYPVTAAVLAAEYLPRYPVWDFISALLLYQLLYLALVMDLVRQVIPNRLILAMLAVWSVLAVGRLITAPALAVAAFLNSLWGFLFAGIIFLAAYLISRRSLGGGDVKLAAVIGLFVTGERVLGAILYGLVLCAIFSLVMILLKKMGRKDAVPLSPFLALGTYIALLIIV